MSTIAQELAEIKDRLDAIEKGDYSASPYTVRLVSEFESIKTNVATLMRERDQSTGIEKDRISRRELVLFIFAILGTFRRRGLVCLRVC